MFDDTARSQSQFNGTATATGHAGTKQSAKTKKEKLEERLKAKNLREEESLRQVREKLRNTKNEDLLDLIRVFRSACTFLGYKPDEENSALTWNFCAELAYKWQEYRNVLQDGEMRPSAFCSKVIDSCLGGATIWPPDFGDHRNLLRNAEKSNLLGFYKNTTPDGRVILVRVDPRSLPNSKKVHS